MKKLTFTIIALLVVSFAAKAQQYVSTEPANRNVILEEFTGRGCQYCPDGHRIANEIMANNPGRAWAINVHAGGYATTDYPNFNTTASATILSGFSVSGFPAGVVNRSTAAGQSRSAWASLTNQQLAQAAECNVAGMVRINPDTRVASITVEVYYTGNSTVAENYLTVAMLQDSILGSQSGGSTWNPTQMINGQYVHMHVLRDMVTPTWGEVITPTTQGTLITKTYEYQLPEVIGNPNGVDVIIDHVFFLAWVSERYQGTPTRPILNACELTKTTMTDDPIHPSISAVSQLEGAECTQEKNFNFSITNIGLEELTSIKFNAQVAGENMEFEWKGELPSGEHTDYGFVMGIPFGTYNGTLSITEVNGEPYEDTRSFVADSQQWAEISSEGETTDIMLCIVQDQWGEQITWDIINSTGEIVAQGGPYAHLVGSGSTQPNIVSINGLAANECYLFRIYDSNNNGICCTYGNGYYYLKDESGSRFIESDGQYGAGESRLFSIHKHGDGLDGADAMGFKIYPNPANNRIYIDGEGVGAVEVYNSLGQRVATVEGTEKTSVDVASFENGVYVVRVITNEGAVSTKKVTIAH